jgi:serine/threonine protein kinase
VYEINVNEQDNPYFTMKLIDGRSLRQVLDGLRDGNAEDIRAHPLESLVSAFRRVCDAIAFAHSKGVLHRDLKPDNVMIGSFGEVVVMDWGLAKPIGSKINIVETMSHRTIVSSARMETPEFATSTDMSLGTPHYMPPEQAGGRGDEMDVRTDVYSLGAMLFEILTLQAPVEGENVYEVVQNLMQGKLRDAEQAVREKTPAHLPNGNLPPELAAIAKKAMAFERVDRFSSVRELSTAVGRWHPREAVTA